MVPNVKHFMPPWHASKRIPLKFGIASDIVIRVSTRFSKLGFEREFKPELKQQEDDMSGDRINTEPSRELREEDVNLATEWETSSNGMTSVSRAT